MEYVKSKVTAVVQPSDTKEYDQMQRHLEILSKVEALEQRILALENAAGN